MSWQDVPPIAQAAAHYALAIRGKRDLLQTLFYATRNNAAEAWALHRRLVKVEQQYGDGSVAVFAGDLIPRQDLRDAKTTAEATAQDSAWALMLIVDYSLQRFRTAAGTAVDSRQVGVEARNGVKLNAAIWALANQARHLHEWKQRENQKLEAQDDVASIRALELDPLDPNAAREFLCGLQVASYIDFEEMLVDAARDVLKKTEYSLGTLTAGTFLLKPKRDNP